MENENQSVLITTSASLIDSKALYSNHNSDQLLCVALDVTSNSTSTVSSRQKTPKDVILVVDISGSMSGVIKEVKQTIVAVGEALDWELDRIAVVTFESVARVEIQLQNVSDCFDHLVETSNKMRAMGSTNMTEGLEYAVNIIKNEYDNNTPQKSDTVPNNSNSNRMTLVCLLSDGQPDCGGAGIPSMLHNLIADSCASIVINSFGFTDHHAAELLQQVTACGNVGMGRYYSLIVPEDVPTAIGDCLGASGSISVKDLSLSMKPVNSNQWECEEYFGMDVMAIEDGLKNHRKVTLSNEERFTFMFVLSKPMEISEEFPEQIEVAIDFRNQDGKECHQTLYINLPNKQEMSTKSPNYFHVLTHVFRLRAAIMLQRTLDPAAKAIVEEMEELHDKILSTLESVQQLDGEQALKDEGVLSSIERDLGEALEGLHEKSGLSQLLRNRLLQYSYEHVNQKAATSMSQMSKLSPYCTPLQIALRLRFLMGSNKKNENEDEKASVPIQSKDETHLSNEIIEKRKEMDEECCYISLEDWRTCQMGIGLLVRPRTARERYRKLIPRVELVEDYVSAEAYNSGVRGMVRSMDNVVDRDDDEAEDQHQALRSSVRGRINAWLPLYINATNWKYAKAWAPSAFSIIATQFNSRFEPMYALNVCAKLMIQNTVKCLLEQERISEKAIQMYCDVHRLLLEMSKEYSDIVTQAEEKLRKFIENPNSRRRADNPDLGDLIIYLTVTDKISWKDLCYIYVQEAFRRNTLHVGHIILLSISTIDELFDTWMQRTNAGRVTMFNVLFLREVARPEGKSIQDIMDSYDVTWGKLSNSVVSTLKKGIDDILQVKTLPEVMKRLGLDISNEALAEMMLWAFDNKLEEPTRFYPPIPESGGPYLSEWLERNLLFKRIEEEPGFIPTLRSCPYKKRRAEYSGLSSTLTAVKEDDVMEISSDGVKCNCDRCQRNVSLFASKPLLTSSGVVFLRRLKKRVKENDITNSLNNYGIITKVHIVRSRFSGKSKGYGFVEFQREEDAIQLLKKGHQLMIRGRTAFVSKVGCGVNMK